MKPQSSEAVYELVTFFQIHNSRLRKYTHDSEDYQYAAQIFDTVKLNHLALRALEYARNEKSFIPNSIPSEKEMMSSLRSMIGFEKIYEPEEKYFELEEIISKYFEVHKY